MELHIQAPPLRGQAPAKNAAACPVWIESILQLCESPARQAESLAQQTVQQGRSLSPSATTHEGSVLALEQSHARTAETALRSLRVGWVLGSRRRPRMQPLGKGLIDERLEPGTWNLGGCRSPTDPATSGTSPADATARPHGGGPGSSVGRRRKPCRVSPVTSATVSHGMDSACMVGNE
mmetsp:Transcript_42330/g.75849  ORF Transcript_42330/g.75849 Transcript_42330/m.75849 type:complete len:179 (+) Transcript_42330:180-716(+)